MVQRIEQAGAEFELGYWAIRGLGQPIRFLLAHAEVAFSEVRLGVNQDGSIVADESHDWTTHKDTLSVPFPNLPYLIDSSGPAEVQLTQSNAVMRYLARQFDYYGDTASDQICIDVLQDEAYDLRNSIVKTVYTLGAEYEAAFDEFTSTAVPRYLDGFESYLSNRGIHTHFVGTRISLVDFILYELIWQVSIMVPGSVTDTHRPSLQRFIEAFAKIPQITAYMARSDYIDRPINSPWASFT
ncbi:MAG: glutathione S-transferase family protein [Alphaproteobacteria bacterium]